MKGQAGFFELDERYAALSEAGDPLERLVKVVDFEVFRHQLDTSKNLRGRNHVDERRPFESDLFSFRFRCVHDR